MARWRERQFTFFAPGLAWMSQWVSGLAMSVAFLSVVRLAPALRSRLSIVAESAWQAQVDTPPLRPEFPDLAPQGLAITNTGGVVALKLTCPIDPGDNIIVRGSKPVSQGIEVCKDFRILGPCPAPVAGSSDITGLYTAR